MLTSSTKKLARILLPDRYYFPLRECYRSLRQNAELWQNPVWMESVQRVRAYRNKHEGRRCFILGTGPSLKKTDLSLLKNEFTFGLNRIYLLFDELKFNTTYYVAVNNLVIEQCAEEIARLPVPKFISFRNRNKIKFSPDLMFLQSRFEPPAFSTDITHGVWEGGTVTYVAIQIAYYMGFQKVILVGVDHSFATKGQPNSMVVSGGADPNHFHPEYFGKGFRWHLPDLEASELAYRTAKYHFERSNREIVDATVDGKLQVFSKVNYLDLF